MMDYFIELFIIHSVLVGIYFLALRKESDYAYMRLYLLGATIISTIIPILKTPEKLIFHTTSNASNNIKSIILSPVTVDYNGFSIGDTVTYLQAGYLIVSIILFVGFFISLFEICKLIQSSKTFQFNNNNLRKTTKIDKSFTFLHWILIEEGYEKDEESLIAIVAHEQAHVRLGHTYDILFLQLFKVCFWWLPSVWYAIKEIKNIHEYQADKHALKQIDEQLYSNLLISSTLKNHGLSLANSFDDGSIFKRLKTMKQHAKKLTKAKAYTLGTVLFSITILFACNEQLDQELQDVANNSYESTILSAKAQTMLDEARAKKPNEEFRYLQYVVEEGQDISSLKDKIADLDNALIESVDINKEEGIIGIVMRKSAAASNYLTSNDELQDEIFTMVEEQPAYPGGMDQLYDNLSNQLKSIMGEDIHKIEGKVYVQFIVEKDGSLSSFKSLKATDERLVKPSILAVSQLKTWLPGKQKGNSVRVRMVLPVIYKLIDHDLSK